MDDGTKKIKYLLILTDREPEESKNSFLQQLLDEAYILGKPYRNCLDSQAKIAIEVVGDQNFDDNFVAIAALSFFMEKWGHKAILDKILYRPFIVIPINLCITLNR